MKTQIKFLIAALFCTSMLTAQVTLGTLKGQVMDKEDKTSIPQAGVWIEGQGLDKKIRTDVDGKFSFEALQPGIYNLRLFSKGKDTATVSEIEIKPDAITNIGEVALLPSTTKLDPIIITYTPPLIRKDVQKIEITTEDIAHSPNIQNPKELFASMNSDIVIPEGSSDMIIRGSRPGDVVYYVDGVKTDDLNGVPGVGIGSMTGYTGGIPAKYGDTTGGVVILETKSYFDLYYAWKARK
ncbi:MAG: carboxypeptidase regulatory-like domain-containing protein [Crocinitomicaceae bacterium]